MTISLATGVLEPNHIADSISVAMATYNGAKFLRQQLDSIAAQSRLPTELVVTDDASTDDTVAILNEFAATAPFPVHIHRNPSRLGYRANFMRAMSLCRSDIVALCDQDDLWEANKTEAAMQAFADPDVVLFFHSAWLIDDAGGMIGPADILALPPRSAPLSFYPMINPFGFSMVFRRALTRFAEHWSASIDSVEATNRMAHDQWIFFLASVFGVIAYSDARLVRYRQHGGNAYGWKPWTAGVWERLFTKLHDNGGTHLQFAAAAAARGRILRAILQTAPARSLSPAERERGERCATFYEGLSSRLALRGEIYMAPRLHRRIFACLRLLRVGGYGRGTMWNIGPKAMVKDVALGLAFRPLLVRYTGPEALAAERLRHDPKVI
jgi:hypothetical protein